MPPKKKTTAKKKAKRNLFDFFRDAGREGSAVGPRFLEEIKKEGVTPKKLYNLLIHWGYEDVRLQDFTKLFNVYTSKEEVKEGVMTMGY
jgi:hypothetical protein